MSFNRELWEKIVGDAFKEIQQKWKVKIENVSASVCQSSFDPFFLKDHLDPQHRDAIEQLPSNNSYVIVIFHSIFEYTKSISYLAHFQNYLGKILPVPPTVFFLPPIFSVLCHMSLEELAKKIDFLTDLVCENTLIPLSYEDNENPLIEFYASDNGSFFFSTPKYLIDNIPD